MFRENTVMASSCKNTAANSFERETFEGIILSVIKGMWVYRAWFSPYTHFASPHTP